MDMGIINAWKKGYRKMMLSEIVINLETRAERRALNRNNKWGMNGIREGYSPHMLDVAKLSKRTWENVTQVCVVGCWMKSQILPVSMDAELRATWGNMRNTSKESVVQELVEMFRKLNLNLEKGDPRRNEFIEELEEYDIEKWCTIEEDESVRTAITDDITEEISKLTLMDDEEVVVASKDDVTRIDALMLPVADLFNLFQPLRAAAVD